MAGAKVKADFKTGLIGTRFKQTWKIGNWLAVLENKALLDNQSFFFETGNASDIDSKWTIELKQIHSGLDRYYQKSKSIEISWKLLEVLYPPNKVQAKLLTQLLNSDGTVCSQDDRLITAEVDQEVNILLSFTKIGCEAWGDVLDKDGSLTILAQLTLLQPTKPDISTKMNKYRRSLMEKMCTNQARLLNDKSTADLKIVTRDGLQLIAHRLILQAQCPVFSTMFHSQFSESTTGVVSVPDITGKTMGILLHYFYTGQLLNTWSDDDTIVEFTYVAGKYRLDEVLQLLDDILGTTSDKETCASDLQLLNLAHKLSLKNAEARLIKRVAKIPAKITDAAGLLALFGNNLSVTDTPDGAIAVCDTTQKPTSTRKKLRKKLR